MSGGGLREGEIVAGDFRVERALAQGGMGTIYVALQISTGKQRALKLMRADVATDERSRERFAVEARAASIVESEHVVEVIGAGFDQRLGVPWLAMELLAGETLADRLRRGPLTPPEALVTFGQVAHALGAAHRAGLVHRDLKPENVFLAQARGTNAPPTVKVLDFGIAKLVSDIAHAGTTASLGSPAWMAPEQANGEPVSPATDVWAFGLVAFASLTGRSYWRAPNAAGSTMQALLTEILMAPLPSASQRASELGARLPQGFDDWFAHCVCRDPRARFSDASQAMRALESVVGTSSHQPFVGASLGAPQAIGHSTALPYGPTDRVMQVTARPPTQSKGGAVAFAIVAVLVVVVGGLFVAAGVGFSLARSSAARAKHASTDTDSDEASSPAPKGTAITPSSSPAPSATPTVPAQSPETPRTPSTSKVARPITSPTASASASSAPTEPGVRQGSAAEMAAFRAVAIGCLRDDADDSTHVDVLVRFEGGSVAGVRVVGVKPGTKPCIVARTTGMAFDDRSKSVALAASR